MFLHTILVVVNLFGKKEIITPCPPGYFRTVCPSGKKTATAKKLHDRGGSATTTPAGYRDGNVINLVSNALNVLY
jgi:hypothetical protein